MPRTLPSCSPKRCQNIDLIVICQAERDIGIAHTGFRQNFRRQAVAMQQDRFGELFGNFARARSSCSIRLIE